MRHQLEFAYSRVLPAVVVSFKPLYVVIFGSLFWAMATSALSAQPPGRDAPAAVRVDEAEKVNRAQQETFVGNLNALRTSTVGSAVEGRVTEMFVDFGSRVGADPNASPSSSGEKGAAGGTESTGSRQVIEGDGASQRFVGEPLAQLEVDSLSIQIAAAKVELNLRQQQLQELELSLPEDIALAKTSVAQAEAELELAEENYERSKRLAEQGGGLSAREIAEYQSSFLTKQQALLAAQSSLKKLQATRQIKLEIAKSRVTAQREELRRLQDQLTKHTIRAPFPGSVVEKMADVGDWLTPGSTVVRVVQTNPIELTIQIPQSYASSLQEALDQASPDEAIRAEVTVEGFTGTFRGKIQALVPQADLRTRSFPVKIRIPNPPTASGHPLKPGMLADARLDVGPKREMVLINKDALILGDQQIRVIVADPPQGSGDSPTARSVVVELGQSYRDRVEVLQGISAGELVVIEGNERIRPGQKLRIINSPGEVNSRGPRGDLDSPGDSQVRSPASSPE